MKISLFVTILILSCEVFAHSGRTDSRGGHWNRTTGTYHYHSYRFNSQINNQNVTRFSNEDPVFQLISVIDLDNKKYQFDHITSASIDAAVSFKIQSFLKLFA